MGKELPDRVLEATIYTNSMRRNSAIFLLTVDRGSFPHVALLSPYQVIALNSTRMLVAVHSASRSASFLKKNGKGTLILQAKPAVVYVKCSFRLLPDIDLTVSGIPESVYSATPEEVLEDYAEKAPFLTELKFDETFTRDPYMKEFNHLAGLGNAFHSDNQV